MAPTDLLTTGQVAEILGVSPATVVNYADAGSLRCFKLPSGVRRFRRADVEALLSPEPQPTEAAS